MSSQTNQATSSKVYMRYYDFKRDYKTDKALPSILDASQNGGKKYSMTKAEWVEFCERIDACFSTMNKMQAMIFFGKIAVAATMFSYIIVMYIAFFWQIRLDLLFGLFGLFVAIILLNCYVQGPMNKKALGQVEEICREKSVNLNLEAGEESAIRIELHYKEWKPFSCCACEDYEVDSKDKTRNASTFLQISRGSNIRSLELPSIDNYYRKNDPEYQTTGANTAPNSDEFLNDVEIQQIATAVPVVETLVAPTRRNANMTPYVTAPMAKASLYENNEQPNNEDVEEPEAVLQPYTLTKKEVKNISRMHRSR